MVVPAPTFGTALPSDAVLALGGWKKFPDIASRAQARRALLNNTPPKAMASPPTGAVNGPNPSPTSGLTQSVGHADTRFGYRCANWLPFNSNIFRAPANNSGADWDAQHYGEIEFGWYGTKIDFRVIATSPVGRMRIRVNGEYIALTAIPITANDGAGYNIAYNFGSADSRHIVIEFCNAGFVGLNLEPTAVIWTPPARSIRALWLGDSYTELVNAAETVINGAPLEASRRLGWDEPWLCGEGSTGYMNDGATSGAPGRKVFRGRLAADVFTAQPDVVVIWGSINDANGSYTGAQIQAAAEAVYSDFQKQNLVGKAGYPTRLIVIGVQQPYTPTNQSIIDANNAVKAACLNYGVPFVDPTGWITGNGKVGATNGSGNADWATTGDGVHPSDAGHLYLGKRIAHAIASLDMAPVG